MAKVKQKNLLLMVLVFLVTVGLYYKFYNSPYFTQFFEWSQSNIVLFVSVLLIIKILALLYPPLSGGVLTLGSIPFLGWPLAYAIDLVGSITSGIIMYFLGKKYGYWLLNKIFSKELVEKIKKMKVKKNKEIEAVFVYRVLIGGTVLELVYYGAGVLGIGFRNFLIGSIGSHLLVGIPTFYLANNVLTSGNVWVVVVSSLVLLVLFSRLKNRYFE